MKKSRAVKIISAILLVITVVITLICICALLLGTYIFVPWAVPWMNYILIENPDKPTITYGEFPFEIVYEINGEIYEIKDTIICNYAGIELSDVWGKSRTWDSALQSGNEKIVLLDVSDKNITDAAGYSILSLYLSYGNAEFYMNDIAHQTARPPNDGKLYIDCIKQSNDIVAHTLISPEEAWEKFGLRIIDVKWSSPINNTFE